MKPGATTNPLASMMRGLPTTAKRPTATMRSPRSARSPTTPAAPLPSYSLPPRTTISAGTAGSLDRSRHPSSKYEGIMLTSHLPGEGPCQGGGLGGGLPGPCWYGELEGGQSSRRFAFFLQLIEFVVHRL